MPSNDCAMIKAIFLDIDGTLVSFKTHRIPQSAIDALSKARERGVKVFIATGRPLPFVNNLDGLEYDGIMTVNGANCQVGGDTVLCHNPISRDDLKRLMEYYRQKPFPVAFASNDDVFMTMSSEEAGEVFELLNLDAPRTAPIGECLDMDVMQIIGFFDAGEETVLMRDVLTGCAAQRWHSKFADVISAGNNKAHGIDTMIGHFGISLDETMAFGDGGNDREMLRHVRYGVAMGNARSEVKEVAHYVTQSVDNDGIALALQKFMGID